MATAMATATATVTAGGGSGGNGRRGDTPANLNTNSMLCAPVSTKKNLDEFWRGGCPNLS
jgi:hypothetical protein